MSCRICDEKATSQGFCRLHAKAYRNLLKGYEGWKDALDISWNDYLLEIAMIDLTGSTVKEVVNLLLNEKMDQP